MIPKRKATAPLTRVRIAPTEDSEPLQPRRSSRQVASKQCDDDKTKTRKIRVDIPERTPSPDYNPNDPHDGAGPAILYPEMTAETSAPDELSEPADRGAGRSPAVNSNYLPLPWNGRLGYACLNTYLRAAKPSVFSSRTWRMDSIIKHLHPLRDPSQPEHPKNNPPRRDQKKFVQDLGLANARDISKMFRWNGKYNIKFFRLSSEMFPFGSHPDHGYTLAPFASEALTETGKVAAELGHRLTIHPGQQQNRDAVMILHMGGVYEGKAAILDRFCQNYATLSDFIKARLSVYDLLPIRGELNIPLVLDYHYYNILFDSSQIRQKMYYSEPCPGAVTPRDRRKHSPRVATLPPCPPDMDLMIEAKDKNFKLPGFEKIRDMILHERSDENVVKKAKKPVGKCKGKRKAFIHEDDVAMGGSEGRVYWPPGREDWLKAAPKTKGKGKGKGKANADVDVKGEEVEDEDVDMA
ncbi:UV-damage endonuclease [Rhypophila decipiens]